MSALPLISFTLWTKYYFESHYINPGRQLTLELARELDEKMDSISTPRKTVQDQHHVTPQKKKFLPQDTFDKKFYKQPVMTELTGEPRFYRMDRQDPVTAGVRDRLKRSRLRMWYPKISTGSEVEDDSGIIV